MRKTKAHKYYFIYMTKNMLNGKKYVGFHASNSEYEKDTYRGSGILLKRKIKEYGEDNFITGIIEYINFDTWKEKEKFWIKEMKSHVSEKGYNLTLGGDGGDTFSYRSQEEQNITKQRLSKKRIKGCSETRKSKISIGNTGKTPWNKNKKGIKYKQLENKI
jgi:group I intron endonuclease